MSDAVAEFVENALGVTSAESYQEGEYIHVYRGQLDGQEESVRFLTLAPDIDDEAIAEAFMQAAGEWQNASTHPNIVTVYDRSDTPRPWVAIADVGGQPLDAAQPNLAPTEVQTVVKNAAEAVRNVALYNTVHGALSPEHIVVVPQDNGVSALVDDWGLRQAVRTAGNAFDVTPFTAPELLDDPTGSTEQTDVYGLGGIAYYSLTGSAPVSGADLTNAIRTGDVTPPSEQTEVLTEAVNDVLLRALAVTPSDRYESAYSFKRAFLQAYTPDDSDTEDETVAGVGADETEDSVDTTEPTNTSAVTTRRAAVGMLGVGVISLGGGWIAAQMGGQDTSDPAAPGTTTTETERTTSEQRGGEESATNENQEERPSDQNFAWNTYQADINNTGSIINGDGLRDKPSKIWEVSTEHTVATQPVIAGDSVLVGTTQGRWGNPEGSLHMINNQSGSIEWTFSPYGRFRATPTVYNDTVYVDSRGTLYSVSLSSGDENWNFDRSNVTTRPPVTVHDGTVYCGNDFSRLFAIDAASGSEIWRFTGAKKENHYRFVQSAAIPTDDSVFFGMDFNENSERGVVFRLDVSDGSEIWRTELDSRLRDSIARSDGHLYCGDDNGIMYKIDAQDGQKVWDRSIGNGNLRNPAVEANNLYTSGRQNVYSVSKDSGDVTWTYDPSDDIRSQPVLIGNTIYVGGESGIYCLDKDTGEELWSYSTQERVGQISQSRNEIFANSSDRVIKLGYV